MPPKMSGGPEEPTWDALVSNQKPAEAQDTASDRFDLPSAKAERGVEMLEIKNPGEYEIELSNGREVSGIPVEATVYMLLGAKNDNLRRTGKNYDKVKEITLRTDKEGRHWLTSEVEDTPEQKAYHAGELHTRYAGENGTNKLEVREGQEIILGREYNEDIFPISDNLSLVSRKHLSIRVQDGKYTFKDLDSSNGSEIRCVIYRPEPPKPEPIPRVKL